MAFCRTKSGTLRLAWGQNEIILDSTGCEVPDDIAETIIGHVNVELADPPAAPEPEPPPAPRKKAKVETTAES